MDKDRKDTTVNDDRNKGVSKSDAGGAAKAAESIAGDRKTAGKPSGGKGKAAARPSGGNGKATAKPSGGNGKAAAKSNEGNGKAAAKPSEGSGKTVAKSGTGAKNGAGRSQGGRNNRQRQQQSALAAVLARTEAALAPSDALVKREERQNGGRKANVVNAPEPVREEMKKEITPVAKEGGIAEKESGNAKGKGVNRRKRSTKAAEGKERPAAPPVPAKERGASTRSEKAENGGSKDGDALLAHPLVEEEKVGGSKGQDILPPSGDTAMQGTPLVISSAFAAYETPGVKEDLPSGASDNGPTAVVNVDGVKAGALGDTATGDAPSGSAATRARRRRRKNSNAKKLYEIDNDGLPEGLPPVEDFAILPLSEELKERGKQSAKANKTGGNRASKGESRRRENGGRGNRKDVETPHGSVAKTANLPPEQGRALTAEIEVEAAVLSLLETSGTPLSRELLLKHINVSPKAMLDGVLLRMLETGKILLSKKRKYALPVQLGYLIGTLQVTTRGFGFLIPQDGSEDVFVAQKALNGAMNGDEVVLRLLEDGQGSREGEVIAVRTHANSRIIGVLNKGKGGYTVASDNIKLSDELHVAKGALGSAKAGQKVVADIEYVGGEPQLHIIEVLGDPEDAETDVLSIIRAHDISQEFPRHVLTAARNLPQELGRDDVMRREDLRALTLFTIDGADAKDFDDAVSCEMLDNGNYLLGVHIADVAHYVRENSALDKEALRRGTSVYLVDRVIPMLPEEISNGICSLRPNEDRFALTCFMEIDKKARVLSHRIAETVICSKERLIYEDVSALLEGDEEQNQRYETLAPTLRHMEALAKLLRAAREKRGSLDFDLPETRIQLDDQGHPIKIGRYERGFANKLIEEFMLICNETVAEHMTYLDRPMLYRVHELPDEDKLRELNIFLGGMGYGLRSSQNGIRPKALQAVLSKAQGKPEEGIISRVVLRTLQKARYADENLGHFGLAAEFYTHFTSPIRRYPDLEVHRIVKELIHGQLTEKRQEALRSKLSDIARQCSEREREAMGAERDVDDLKKAEYLADHIGEMFDGVVSGVTSFGMFVALPNTCEGMVRISEIGDDYYSYDEKNYRIIGRHNHQTYTLGDSVRVVVQHVDTNARKVDFSLVHDKEPRGRRPRKSRN